MTHEDVTFEELGGAMTHNAISGVSHVAADNETDALALIRELLTYLPQNNLEDPPFEPTGDDSLRADERLDTIVPDNPNKPYDMKEVIRMVVDNGQFFEIHEHFARNIIVGFARLGGTASASLPTSPLCWRACRTSMPSVKAGRFVRFCDCFNIRSSRLRTPGSARRGQEHGGIIRHGASCCTPTARRPCPRSR